MKQYETIKIYKSTKKLAKIVASYLNTSLVSLFQRLIKEEAKKLGLEHFEDDI